MGKTRDLCKKIKDIKGVFYARMGMVKDRNCRDLTETEEIRKRQQGCFPCNWDNFENYFASMCDECNCLVVWTIFGIALPWDWNEN